MRTLWKADLHCHTHYSRDCLTAPQQLVEACVERGIACLAVTDHDAIDGAFEVQQRAPFRVIIGEEIKTARGEIIGLFLQEFIPPGLPVMETIERIRAQGGLVYVPHPFDFVRRSTLAYDELQRIWPYVDILEVFNARTISRARNIQGAQFAEAHGLVKAAGSDAHTPGEIGYTYNLIEPFEGPQDLLAKLRCAELRVSASPLVVHLYSRLAKWSRRLGLRPLPPRRRPAGSASSSGGPV